MAWTDREISDITKIIVAIILPPLGVFLEKGADVDFLINIGLTLLGWIPGVIHAIYIIGKSHNKNFQEKVEEVFDGKPPK